MWPQLPSDLLETLPKEGLDSVSAPSRESVAGWKNCIDRLMVYRQHEEDWDGLGAPAISPEIVDSAVILAVQLRQFRVARPVFTVPTFQGSVSFQCQWPDTTTLDIELTEPYSAEIFLLSPTLPT